MPPQTLTSDRASVPALSLKIEREPFWILDRFLDLHQEGDCLFTIDQAMVVGEREIHHRPRHDLPVAHHGALLDATHAYNARLRRVQDRGGEQRAVDAAIGDGEGAA